MSKNAPTLASCSFDKHELVLIIVGQQHQCTFKNAVPIQLSLSLHFCLLYLLLNSSDGNDVKRNVFSIRLLVALKSDGCRVVTLKKVLVQQMFKVMSFRFLTCT